SAPAVARRGRGSVLTSRREPVDPSAAALPARKSEPVAMRAAGSAFKSMQPTGIEPVPARNACLSLRSGWSRRWVRPAAWRNSDECASRSTCGRHPAELRFRPGGRLHLVLEVVTLPALADGPAEPPPGDF